jgi:hypothetical protein
MKVFSCKHLQIHDGRILPRVLKAAFLVISRKSEKSSRVFALVQGLKSLNTPHFSFYFRFIYKLVAIKVKCNSISEVIF